MTKHVFIETICVKIYYFRTKIKFSVQITEKVKMREVGPQKANSGIIHKDKNHKRSFLLMKDDYENNLSNFIKGGSKNSNIKFKNLNKIINVRSILKQ